MIPLATWIAQICWAVRRWWRYYRHDDYLPVKKEWRGSD